MKNSRRKKEHLENAIIETGEKATKLLTVGGAITFFMTYLYSIYLDIRDKKNS